MANLPPGMLILLGALLVPLLRGRIRPFWTIGVPLISLAHLLWFHPEGFVSTATMFDFELVPIRVDRLSLVWGYIFHVAAVIASVYALHVRDRVELGSAMVYVGASIGAVFAGDLLTLFLFWEMTAISSVFLIWAGSSKDALATGMRYLVMHVGSGVLVLSGAILLFAERGTLSFGAPGEVGLFHELSSAGAIVLLLGFGIKAAFPLLHCWLPDAYPKSTVTGTVFLSAFTTKMAIYALARGFAGCELLIPIGCVMAIFPLVHAILADDMRRTLSHVLNNQLGFMVVAIGIGTPFAISAAAAQAFAHVLYKGLLFMAIGAVLYRTGTARQSKLGGLAGMMPWTCACCLVGALSVAPFVCGFVTKGMILSAVAEAHLDTVWLVLIVGSVGALWAGGIKIVYFTFFARPYPPAEKVHEAPIHMLVAMTASAALCLLIGMAPNFLLRLLPNADTVAAYHVYTVPHVVTQLQLILFTGAGVAFSLLLRQYPQTVPGTLLDVDWFYRKPLPAAVKSVRRQFAAWDMRPWRKRMFTEAWERMTWQCSEAGPFGQTVSTNTMAFAAILLLAVYLIVYYR